MAISVACPKCQAPIEVSADMADQPTRCQRCGNIFRPAESDSKAHANGIQVGAPRRGPTSKPQDDEPMPPSRPHATARAPFPVVPLLVLLCGFLFLLLILSGGFNFWLIAHPDAVLRGDEIRLLQAQAAEANARAAQAAVQEEQARREIQELRKKLDAAERRLLK